MGDGEVQHQVRQDVFFFQKKVGALEKVSSRGMHRWGLEDRAAGGQTAERMQQRSWEGSRTWTQSLEDPKGERWLSWGLGWGDEEENPFEA